MSLFIGNETPNALEKLLNITLGGILDDIGDWLIGKNLYFY